MLLAALALAALKPAEDPQKCVCQDSNSTAWLMLDIGWGERGGGERGGGGGISACEETDRHALLLAGLGFRNLLDGPCINDSQAILLSLHILLADGCGRPVQNHHQLPQHFA